MFKDFASLLSNYISAFSLASIYNSLVSGRTYQISDITAQSMDTQIVREKRRLESDESSGQGSPPKWFEMSNDSAFSEYSN